VHRSVLAEFSSARGMVHALEELRRAGYHRLEYYAPYPVSDADRLVRGERSRLPRVAFAAGVLGALAGYVIQWYVNAVDYPLNAGGRPTHAVPAFVPATFEAMVLAAALAVFVGLFLTLGLPALWHPVFEVEEFERTSADRYWAAVQAEDPDRDAGLPDMLRRLGPLRVIEL
jgi:hypothetical protein